METGVIVGILAFLIVFLLIIIRVPLWVAIMSASLFGFCILGGTRFALSQFLNAPFAITASYTFAILPLFVVLGILAGETGAGAAAFDALARWLAPVRGGLLMATIGANIIFGACSSLPVASLAVFSRVVIPQLDRVGIDRKVSIGAIVSSAGLASLIPPSTIMVILAMLVELSVGKLLLAGVIPGILLGLLLMGVVFVWSYVNPQAIPRATEKYSWRERFISLGWMWPIGAIFLVSIGGIYTGIFTPTAAGAAGAFTATLYAVYRRMSWKKIFACFGETAKLGGQLIPLLLSGFLFSRAIALTRLPDFVTDLIVGSGLPLYGFLAIVMIFYLFLGCIMDFLPMLIITLPVIFPAVVALGFDPIAFGVIIVILGGCAIITPPIGMLVFAASAMTDIKVADIFRGVLPFYTALLAALVLLIIFPGVATWLPNMMRGG